MEPKPPASLTAPGICHNLPLVGHPSAREVDPRLRHPDRPPGRRLLPDRAGRRGSTTPVRDLPGRAGSRDPHGTRPAGAVVPAAGPPVRRRGRAGGRVMTGPEHFREAEMLANEGCDYGCPHTGCEHHVAYLLQALVHSNLAVAAPRRCAAMPRDCQSVTGRHGTRPQRRRLRLPSPSGQRSVRHEPCASSAAAADLTNARRPRELVRSHPAAANRLPSAVHGNRDPGADRRQAMRSSQVRSPRVPPRR